MGIVEKYRETFDFHKREGATNYGPFVRFFSYPFAILVVTIIKKWRIFTPNFVTSLSLFCHIVGCVILVYIPEYHALLLSLSCFYLSMVLDSCDGLLARINKQQSQFGGFYDILTDQLGGAMIFIAVSIRLSIIDENFFYIGMFCIGIIQVNGVVDTLLNSYKKDQKLKDKLSTGGALIKNKGPILKIIENTIGFFGTIYSSLFLFLILNRLDLFLFAFPSLVLVLLMKRIYSFYKIAS